MRAVHDHGTPLVDDPGRLDGVATLGLDETSFLKATQTSPTRWVTGLVDLDRGRLLDVVADRTRAALERFYRWADGVGVVELTRLARTVRTWEAEVLAFHATGGCSNGPTEAVNLLIKKVKRVGHGFRNFTNYRLRLLLHCGSGGRLTAPRDSEAAIRLWWRRATNLFIRHANAANHYANARVRC
jgi:transposase